jgi:hypothetical protein
MNAETRWAGPSRELCPGGPVLRTLCLDRAALPLGASRLSVGLRDYRIWSVIDDPRQPTLLVELILVDARPWPMTALGFDRSADPAMIRPHLRIDAPSGAVEVPTAWLALN